MENKNNVEEERFKQSQNIMESMGLHAVMNEKEYKDRQRANYEYSKVNPENMSYWLPKILSSSTKDTSSLFIPETKIFQLSYSTWRWLRSDNYSEEQIAEFDKLLKKEIDNFLEGKRLFMKTGVFSDKFYFPHTTIDAERKNNIGQQLLNIYYNSLIVGAANTSEVAFREFVESKEDVPAIYRGMLLHTEFRVFYDFDKKRAVGVSNYWHPSIMENGLYDKKDQYNYGQAKDKLLTEYDQYKETVIQEVEKFMSGCNELKGAWSVDVMKNGEEYWLIDMARMERSALVDVMEIIE